MKQKHSAAPAWMSRLKIPILILVLSVLVLFAASFVLASEKQAALFSTLAILVMVITPQFRRKLKAHGSIFFFLVTAYVIYAGVSTLYAYAPKLALSEYSRLLSAYAVFLAVFTFASPEAMPKAASVLSGSITLLSFLHLDAASWGIIAPKIMGAFQAMTGGYQPNESGMVSYGFNIGNGRLNGLFGNANTMACMCAIGLFLTIYLLTRAEGRKRILPCVALLINGVTFMLCISLGATAALGLTVLLVTILLHGAKNRLTFLLITLETLVSSAIVTILSISHLGNPGPAGFLVWLYCILGIALLFGLDLVLRPRLIELLCRRLKTLCIGVAVLVVIIAGVGILLFTQTASVTLTGSDTLVKRFSPGAGECKITLEVDGEAQLRITSSTRAEILQVTSTQILNDPYTGPVTVEIPDDTIEVQLYISPADDGTITVSGISYAGSEKSADMTPGYRWIPKDILQRLQGLSTNHSAMQRIVFMEDGLKLWKQTPIFGRGLGGFENGVTSVQSFFYETKYAHNHYIQLLVDLGVVGLALFVAMLVFAFKAFWALRRKEDATGLAPALLGVILMYAIHGAIELSPSVAEVSIFAFGALGLTAGVTTPMTALKKRSSTVAWATSIGAAVLFGIYAILLLNNAQASTKAASGNLTMDDLVKYAKSDVFEGNDYRLSYVVNSTSAGDPAVTEKALEFADELRQETSNSTGPYLTEFYLQLGLVDEAAAVSNQYLTNTRSVAENWNIQLSLFQQYLLENLDNEAIRDSLVQLSLDTYEHLQVVNAQQQDELPLTADNAAYLNRLLATDGDLETRLDKLYFDSTSAPDTNQDGLPDALRVLVGQLQADGGQYTAETDVVLQLELNPTHAGIYTLELITDSSTGVLAAIPDYELQYLTTGTNVTAQWSVPMEALDQPLDVRVQLPQGTTIQQFIVELT